MANMLSNKEPWDLVAPGYTDITMKMFRIYALAALDLIQTQRDDHLIDIACGPGTVAVEAAPRVQSIEAVDFSQAMLDKLHAIIKDKGISNIHPRNSDCQHLPYENEKFDAAISLFGLMFFPDRIKGYAEIYRTLKPGGRTVISSWAPVAESNGFQLVFGTLRAINPNIPEPQTEIESLENPEFFKSEMEQAGFKNVEIHRVTGEIPFTNADDFWNDMVRANAPIAMFKNSMSEDDWTVKNQTAIEHITQQTKNKPKALQAHAWLGFGVK
ncbi:MAG: class I SAM-dependent methyltransferase [Gammaproteobacteria bacterium]|nr:class I SAM-dependent methyltransferase [Gammaproteobacteria bacterium]